VLIRIICSSLLALNPSIRRVEKREGFDKSDYIFHVGVIPVQRNLHQRHRASRTRIWTSGGSSDGKQHFDHSTSASSSTTKVRVAEKVYSYWLLTATIRSVFYSAGNIEAMAVTENGEHFFVATSGEKWEIDAQKRLVDICAKREESEMSQKILSAYAPLCDPPSGWKPTQPSVASFVFFGSMCTSGIHCPGMRLFGTT
jgi:hypothetical protein